jgi:hypothetical protein
MVTDTLTTALKTLKKPVYRLAYNPKTDSAKRPPSAFFTFQTVLAQPSGYADDDSTITLHTFRVDLYTKSDFTQLLADTQTALKQAGFIISTVDAEIYENDTGYYHVPLTIKILEE